MKVISNNIIGTSVGKLAFQCANFPIIVAVLLKIKGQ